MLTGQLLMPVAHITDYSMQKWPPQHHSCPLGTWQHLQIVVYTSIQYMYIQHLHLSRIYTGTTRLLTSATRWRPKVDTFTRDGFVAVFAQVKSEQITVPCTWWRNYPNIWLPLRIFKSAECPFLLSVFHGGGIVDFAADCWVISNNCGFDGLFFIFYFLLNPSKFCRFWCKFGGLFLRIHSRNVSVANPTPWEITITLSSCLLNIIRQVEA